MPAHDSPRIFGRPTYRLIQRFALNAALDAAVGASSQAVQVILANIQLPIPTQKQALRIVSGAGLVTDVNQTHFLTANGAAVVLTVDPSLQVRRSWPTFFAPVLLGLTGMNIPINDPEFIFGSDYGELAAGGITQLQLTVQVDISNSDAAPHNVHSRVVSIVELYELDTFSPGPFTRESQLAAQGVPANLLR